MLDRDFVQFEIKIGLFARLLAVKIAKRAFTDFVETDGEEVGLGAFSNYRERTDVTPNFA